MFFFTDKNPYSKIEYIQFSSTGFSGPSVFCLYHELFSLVNNNCNFSDIRGFFNFLSP
uniref:NADH-plastoquinone oxidoreductase subunit 4 n=1 Tax=Staphylea bumalda TaxID=1048799 RepID=UPI002237137E|nr:NADH-plastoquinone oxidoreductase subunit 4 [Staphylea bumalda]UYF20469.1 NADH-plastoquinone oxidoreductase subunit 4 [Staphylea bumalda]